VPPRVVLLLAVLGALILGASVAPASRAVMTFEAATATLAAPSGDAAAPPLPEAAASTPAVPPRPAPPGAAGALTPPPVAHPPPTAPLFLRHLALLR
jgi:hypothetical protein